MSNILYPALLSSIVETSITHPIDVIKIHKQTCKPIVYQFKNLYSGFIPRAIGNIPSRTIFLFSQDYLQILCNKNYQVNKNIQSFVIPLCVGFSQTLVDTPVEVLKMNKIMKIKNNLKTNLKINLKINLLYKGFMPHFGRNFIFVLSVYNFKQLSINNKFIENQYFTTAIYGAIGGVIGSYLSHPLDTIKTCIQTNKNYNNFTIKDYFKGCNLRASMSLCNMFISLYIFEVIKKY